MDWGSKTYRSSSSSELKAYEGQGSGIFYYENYPYVYIKDSTVITDNLVDDMKMAISALNSVAASKGLKGFIITSGNDARHMATSYHYKDRAVDVSTYEATTYPRQKITGIEKGGAVFEAIVSQANSLGHRYDIIWESDHIHIEYDPKGDIEEAAAPETNPGSERDDESKQDNDYIWYTHFDFGMTLLDVINQEGSILHNYDVLGYTAEEWMDEIASFDGGTGKSNRERIEESYLTIDDEAQYEWPDLPFGSIIMIPSYSILKDVFSLRGINQTESLYDLPLYRSAAAKALFDNKNYSRVDVSQYKFKSTAYTVNNIDFNLSVWVYCRSDNKVHNITHLCTAVQTSCSQRDTFSISLPFVREEDQIPNLLYKVYSTDIKQKVSDFAGIVSENDIVFIRFEELEIEIESEGTGALVSRQIDDEIIDVSALAGNYYDFIGFVDSVTQVRDFGNGSGGVTVSGSSLQKLFTQDQAVFMPIVASSAQYGGNIILGGQNSNGVRRTFATGNYELWFTHSYRSVQNTLQFIMNLLSSTGLVPDDGDRLFSSWGDKRTYISEIDDSSGTFQSTQTLAQGVYQIIKIAIDPALQKRYLTDANLTNPQGTFWNLFNKICVWPLAEVFTDVYGDSFDVVCRVPPFTKTQIESFLYSKDPEKEQEEEIENEEEDLESLGYDNVIKGSVKIDSATYIVSVRSNEVQSENLSWESNFYTWYKIEMTGSWIGGESSQLLSYIPILYLDEYVQRWGMREMQVTTPYSVAPEHVGNASDRLQAVSDLLYCVESTAYLPFTRRGTLTLNRGDRRIKKGMWILYTPTDELFYVDSVSQSYSISDSGISRTTEINVSRGMVRSCFEDYFKIVDLEGLKQMLDDMAENPQLTAKSSLKIDKDIFNSFLERKQFGFNS